MSNNKLYQTWIKMKARCHNHKSSSYHNYGGRGIKVCDRWLKSFENFYEDMGDRPEGMTLDRIDNDGDYSPENCRWATSSEQARNTRNTKWYTINGVEMCLTDWCKHYGIHITTVRSRLMRGETITEALRIKETCE